MDQVDKNVSGKNPSGLTGLFSTAEKITDSGSFDWDVKNDKAIFSDGMFRVLGISPEKNPNLKIIDPLVHPDDADGFRVFMEEFQADYFKYLHDIIVNSKFAGIS